MAKLFNRAWMTVTGTPGTGTITLGAAFSAAYNTFAEAGVGNARLVPYVLEDGDNFEIGEGTYTVSGTTLSRDTVTASKIAGVAGTSKINASSAATVFILPRAADFREILQANRTYYVRTDGSDSNNGLADSAGGAFLTIQKAIDVIAATLDVAGFTVTIQVKDGTFTGANTLRNVVGFGGAGTLIIVGNTGTPTNVVISPTSANCFKADGIYTTWDLRSMRLQTTTSGTGLYALNNSTIQHAKVDFGACATYHMRAENGATIVATDVHTISGAAVRHSSSLVQSRIIQQNGVITITGTLAFTVFAFADGQSRQEWSLSSFSGGTITGKRYQATNLSFIMTNGGGANFFPGDAAGTAAAGDFNIYS